MRILVISSSPRKEKSNTFLLAKEVLRGSSNGKVNSEIIHLCDCKVDFCRHCEQCHRKIMHCPIKDDVHTILEKMLEVDGIILATPNYITQVTASMKAILDRSSHFIHCKRLLGKFVAGVVSSESGNDKDVLDYVRYYAHICGAQYSGGVSSRAPVGKEKMGEAFRLGKRFASDIKKKKKYTGQIEIIKNGKEYFRGIIKARKDAWKGEYQYWINKGWV